MYARWASFAVGLGLMLAPLVVGYAAVAPILQEIAMGVLVCIATLAALERPLARFVLGAPALWLLVAGRSEPRAVAVVELSAGALLLLLAVVPSARLARPPAVTPGARA